MRYQQVYKQSMFSVGLAMWTIVVVTVLPQISKACPCIDSYECPGYPDSVCCEGYCYSLEAGHKCCGTEYIEEDATCCDPDTGAYVSGYPECCEVAEGEYEGCNTQQGILCCGASINGYGVVSTGNDCCGYYGYDTNTQYCCNHQYLATSNPVNKIGELSGQCCWNGSSWDGYYHVDGKTCCPIEDYEPYSDDRHIVDGTHCCGSLGYFCQTDACCPDGQGGGVIYEIASQKCCGGETEYAAVFDYTGNPLDWGCCGCAEYSLGQCAAFNMATDFCCDGQNGEDPDFKVKRIGKILSVWIEPNNDVGYPLPPDGESSGTLYAALRIGDQIVEKGSLDWSIEEPVCVPAGEKPPRLEGDTVFAGTTNVILKLRGTLRHGACAAYTFLDVHIACAGCSGGVCSISGSAPSLNSVHVSIDLGKTRLGVSAGNMVFTTNSISTEQVTPENLALGLLTFVPSVAVHGVKRRKTWRIYTVPASGQSKTGSQWTPVFRSTSVYWAFCSRSP